FKRLDVNRDQSLSLSEWPFQSTHPEAKFFAWDGNFDGELTEAEFLAVDKAREAVLRRDFKVFDANGDDRLSPAEFLTIPQWVPEDQRTAIPDPVVPLSE